MELIQEEYETRKANLDETYKEMLHEFSECPEAYSAMREKNIYSILSKRFLLEHDKSASTINTNNIAGTSVYLDPEYDRTGIGKRISSEEYETRKANLDETYKEMLHEFSECPEAYL
ncbi:hypothetical protein L1987_54112 [Smallanthus sonchifolius]|uniref:Uncharacterized protein n=1 Tax=Smallanthus sonchifolius TaxID=185202 RepID=A0ACB9E6L8_9ASTR|nr:hypothetical protein L1987_54112 [Smallanthus sonchifolius]